MLPPMFLGGRRLLMTAAELYPAQKMGRVKWQMYHCRSEYHTIVYVGSNFVGSVVCCFCLEG